MIDPVFSNIISISLFCLLASAAVGKLRNHQAFVQILSGYQLLPELALRPFAWLIPLLELCLALSVFVLGTPYTWAAVAGLLALYAVAILVNVQRGNLSLDCGCHFGEARQSVSMSLVYRNFAIAGTALLLLLPHEVRQLGAYDYAVIVVGVMISALLYVITNTLIANSTNYREVLS